MAKHHHHYRRRRNPLGISVGVVKDAAYGAAGALGSLFLAGKFNLSGWMGVLGTGAASVAVSFAGKFVGGAKASEELLKGGLIATLISAVHQAGFASSLGLGLYGRSAFAVPTVSDQFLRTPPGVVAMLPPASRLSGMGAYPRYRSRYS